MHRSGFRLYLALALVALLLATAWWSSPYWREPADALHVAVVGQGLAPGVDNGILRGALLHVEEVNAGGGIHGRPLRLDILDDQGEPAIGAQRAREVVESSALAAIGHRFSAVSAAAGPIYAVGGIPVVSAASTDPGVTQGNDWYFRTVFDNRAQGRFLAGYIREVLGERKVSVVHGAHDYGRTLARVFDEHARALGMRVTHRWELSDEITAESLVDELSDESNPGLLFLALYPQEALPVIRSLREGLPKLPIMGGNSLARDDLPGLFAELPQERAQPGFYTDGLLVATPLIYDTANQSTGAFRRRYLERFGSEPDWRAAFAYDAMQVIAEALRQSGVQAGQPLAEQRRALRARIAAFDSPARALPGVTGANWFDADGNAQKPLSVAQFESGRMISAPFQLGMGHARGADQAALQRTEIIYTGADLERIDEIDLAMSSVRLRGQIWFRHHGEVDAADILFLNAQEPVTLGEPIEAVTEPDGVRYVRYRFDGRFLLDQFPGSQPFGEHRVGIALRHRLLERTDVVYVSDLLGMGLESSITERVRGAAPLAPGSGWRVAEATTASEVIGVSAQGHPAHTADGGERDFSTFNLVVRIASTELTLRRTLPLDWAIGLVGICLLALIGIGLVRTHGQLGPLQRLWWLELAVALGLLVGIEASLTAWYATRLELRWMELLVTTFDILWWLVPALFINLALERFLWKPIEQKSDRPVPGLLRAFVATLILLFALFGVIAFVFDEKVTSLLASSGVIAMIIGLAVQLNISHLFSGIALNLERPFRVGDWVKIGDHEDARVVAMNWRATRLVTRNQELISLPNTKAAESKIKNYAMPTEVTRLMHKVRVHPRHDTRAVAALLSRACLAVDGVLEDPAPIIFYKGVTEWASEFDAAFFIGDYQQQPKLMTDVWHSIWATLREAGIEPEIQRQNVRLVREEGDTH